jgi:hypothetical protein
MIVIGRLVFSALFGFLGYFGYNRTASLRCFSFPYLPQIPAASVHSVLMLLHSQHEFTDYSHSDFISVLHWLLST